MDPETIKLIGELPDWASFIVIMFGIYTYVKTNKKNDGEVKFTKEHGRKIDEMFIEHKNAFKGLTSAVEAVAKTSAEQSDTLKDIRRDTIDIRDSQKKKSLNCITQEGLGSRSVC